MARSAIVLEDDRTGQEVLAETRREFAGEVRAGVRSKLEIWGSWRQGAGPRSTRERVP